MAAYEEIYGSIGDKVAGSADRLVELIKAIVEDEKNRNTLSGMSDKGVKAILDHVKKGGDIRMQDVPSDYTPVFEAIMRSEGIPYIAMDSKSEDKKNRIFITRDRDIAAMGKVWGRLWMEINPVMEKPKDMNPPVKQKQEHSMRKKPERTIEI